jgi:non-specific serine/threonine protein kinase
MKRCTPWRNHTANRCIAHGRYWAGLDSWLGRPPPRRQRIQTGLRLAKHLDDRATAATYLEALAWIAAEDGKPARAVALMGAAETVGRTVGNYVFLFPNLPVFHDECDRCTRNALDAQAYEAAHEEGRSLSFHEAVAYALAE